MTGLISSIDYFGGQEQENFSLIGLSYSDEFRITQTWRVWWFIV